MYGIIRENVDSGRYIMYFQHVLNISALLYSKEYEYFIQYSFPNSSIIKISKLKTPIMHRKNNNMETKYENGYIKLPIVANCLGP